MVFLIDLVMVIHSFYSVFLNYLFPFLLIFPMRLEYGEEKICKN